MSVVKRKILLKIFIIITLSNCKTFGQEGGKVDEQFLKAVVHIKVNNNSGTGFIIGVENENFRNIFLVTYKHMIGTWSPVDSFIPAREINVTIYRNDSKVPFFDIIIPISDSTGKLNSNVKIQPQPTVDVVSIFLNDFLRDIGKVSFNTLDIGFLCPLDSIKKTTFIGLGSQVFAVGYPLDLKISRSSEPIVKTGYVASSFSGNLNMQVTWLRKDSTFVSSINPSRYFLVDGFIIPGNSGGPVLSPRISIYYENGELYTQDPPIQNRILGIVSYINSNTGICTVYAADYILELIKSQNAERKPKIK